MNYICSYLIILLLIIKLFSQFFYSKRSVEALWMRHQPGLLLLPLKKIVAEKSTIHFGYFLMTMFFVLLSETSKWKKQEGFLKLVWLNNFSYLSRFLTFSWWLDGLDQTRDRVRHESTCPIMFKCLGWNIWLSFSFFIWNFWQDILWTQHTYFSLF